MKYKISRSTFYDPANQRIDILDDRFYFHAENPDVFYPSVTHILEAFPKGWALTEWHKALGFNADIVLQRAAEKGSNVHNGIKKYLDGIELIFGRIIGDKFEAFYTFEEWEMLCKFVEFWERYKPELIAAEVVMISEQLKLGGTIDLVCRIKNAAGEWETWIIDTKTGNSVYPSHELQIATYATMWNEQNPDYFIQRAGILHLDALTRGEDKKGEKIQGKGWQIKEFDRHYHEAFKIFKSLKLVWDDLNPEWKPKNLSLPGKLIWDNCPNKTIEIPDINHWGEGSSH